MLMNAYDRFLLIDAPEKKYENSKLRDP